MKRCAHTIVWSLIVAAGCGAPEDPMGASDAAPDVGSDARLDAGSDADASGVVEGPTFTVMTFNIGTTPGLDHDRGEDDGTGDGYTKAMAEVADALYENSLSWNPAEAALTRWLAEVQPDVAVFQEGFHDPWCADIEVDPALDFVCEGWTPTRPWQIERIFGDAYQFACADGQVDNCVAVKRSFATIQGCDPGSVCEGGLAGSGPPSGCSRGARVGAATLTLADGGELVVVNVHGSSGFSTEDQSCRVDQFRQIFEDRGDGQPAASGARNLVMGDLNTDPVRARGADPSADAFVELMGERFRFLSPTDPRGPATYAGIARIDHVVSDALEGDCVIPGSSLGTQDVFPDTIYWDHKPVVCQVRFTGNR